METPVYANDEVGWKYAFNKICLWSILAVCIIFLIVMVSTILIIHAANANNNNPTSTLSKNPLVDAMSAAMGEVMSSGEWESVMLQWFNETKVAQQPATCKTAVYPTEPYGNLKDVISAGKIRFGNW
jgi:hypothetical protein